MRVLILSLLILFMTTLAFAKDVFVHGYTKRNGTYVSPHYRSAPDNSVNNNWSTKGNVNPYTGKVGTKEPSYGTRSYDSVGGH